MRYTLRQLQLFVAACDAGSVTLAAEREFISQSAASAAIAQLERSLDVQFLLRHHAHGVQPTPAGRQFLSAARDVLRQATDLDRFASSLMERVAGPLDLGCLVTLAPMLIPRLCQEFQAEHPEVSIRFTEAGQDELLANLRNGALSLAVTYDLGLADGIDFERLAELPPHALLAGEHPLSGRAVVSLAELAAEPFVLLDLPLSRDYFRSLFQAQGVEPNVRHRSPHLDVVRAFVANGYGWSLVNARPLVNQAIDGRAIVSIPLAGDHRPMHLGLAAPAGVRETRAAAAFRGHCRARIDPAGVPGILVPAK